MALRMCLGWQGQTCSARTSETRCPTHKAMQRKAANAKPRPHSERRPEYGAAERERRAEVVRAWRAEFGDWCPGYGVPAHNSTDLTADHLKAVAAGGAEQGPLSVLCRSCNGRKKHH